MARVYSAAERVVLDAMEDFAKRTGQEDAIVPDYGKYAKVGFYR